MKYSFVLMLWYVAVKGSTPQEPITLLTPITLCFLSRLQLGSLAHRLESLEDLKEQQKGTIQAQEVEQSVAVSKIGVCVCVCVCVCLYTHIRIIRDGREFIEKVKKLRKKLDPSWGLTLAPCDY